MTYRTFGILLLIAAFGCGDAEPATPKAKPAAAKPADPPKVTRVPSGYDPHEVDVEEEDEDEPYVPKEFAAGANRWRDSGVYLDGKPIAMLEWAELPLSMPITWIKVKVSAPKRYDHPEETGWAWGKERRYRFTDYLKALGVDLKRVKAIHVYGPRVTDSVVATGKDLRSRAAENFQFRFGATWSGKALPSVPPKFGNGRKPDKIAAVTIYVDKTPPRLDPKLGFILDGQVVDGIPYFGEPLRGGVRVYLDDRLAAYIKRQDLPVARATKDANGDLVWKLYDVLALQGVATDKIVEAWIVRDNKRQERLTKDELAAITFTAGSRARGKILLGPKELPAKSLMLHTRPVDPAQLPGRDPAERQ